MKKYLVLLLFNLTHAWNWLKRLFVGPKPWQYDRSMILANLFLGGFFETWPEGVTCCVNLAEENKYRAPLGKFLLDLGRADLPPAQTPLELQTTVDFIASMLKLGHVVLVLCDLGTNRSGLVMCAYVAASMGLTAERARAFVAVKRNKHVLHEWQMDALKAYVASITGQSP